MRNFNLHAISNTRTSSLEQSITPYEVALENFNTHIDGLDYHVAFAFKKNKTSIALEQLGYSQEGFFDAIKDAISRIIDFIKGLFKSSPSSTETARVEKIIDKVEQIKEVQKDKPTDKKALVKAFAENEELVKKHSTVAVALLYNYDSDIRGNPQQVERIFNILKLTTLNSVKETTPVLDLLDKYSTDQNMTEEQLMTDFSKLAQNANNSLMTEIGKMSTIFDLGTIGKRLGIEEPDEESAKAQVRAFKQILFTPLDMDKNKIAKEVINFYLDDPDKMLAYLSGLTKTLKEIDTKSFEKQIDTVLERMKGIGEKLQKKTGDGMVGNLVSSIGQEMGTTAKIISIFVLLLNKLVSENTKTAEAVVNFIHSQSK